MIDFLHLTFLNNRVIDYFLALTLIIIGFFLVWLLKRILIRRLKKIVQRSATTVDDFLLEVAEKKLLPLFYYISFYVGISVLKVAPILQKAIEVISYAVFIFVGVRVVMAVIAYAFALYLVRIGDDGTKKNALKGIEVGVKVLIWGIAVAVFLENLGVEISALVAGLGIGGIAVALAAQTILGDLFSYVTIYFDRPFEIGDFIIIGEFVGTVEHIGIKTTRLRSIGGEQLVLSNSDLTASRLKNFKRMEQRRVLFKIGLTYDTPREQLKEIPGIIKDIIESIEDTLFDRAHFATYAAYSLDFEIVYYVLTRDYYRYMDIQQEINFRLMEEFDKRGIKFAFPTQTVHIEQG